MAIIGNRNVSSMTTDRVLALQGVHNFRDFGGYATSGGGRIRRGLLWRSGQHNEASDADLETIAGLGLATFIDLRGPEEREAHPNRLHHSFAAHVIDSDEQTASLAPHIATASDGLDAEGARVAMRALYAEMPFRPSLVGLMRRQFKALAGRDGASLVHCHAGKDRTGVAVALVQHTLGIHRDDIAADYMMTQTAGNNEARMAAMRDRPRPPEYAMISEEAGRVLMGVDESFLDAAFGTIKARHGSIESYLVQVLDVSGDVAKQLRGKFSED